MVNNKQKHTTMNLETILENICEKNVNCGLSTDGSNITQRVYYNEDNDGNIYFDTESMEEELRFLIISLEQHNENSKFNPDNL